MQIFPCPRSRLRIWSRETGWAVPSRVSLLISIHRLNLVLTYGIPPKFCGGVYLFIYNRHTPSGQSRVYRVTQLHTDGVHCRESAGAGPVNLKVVLNECCPCVVVSLVPKQQYRAELPTGKYCIWYTVWYYCIVGELLIVEL